MKLLKYLSCILLLWLSGNVLATGCVQIEDVSCGENHSLILDTNYKLWACGSNSLLTLGVGSSVSNSSVPLRVKNSDGTNDLNENIVSFDAGWMHSLACDSSGYVWAWGTDSQGQLGNGSGSNSEYPQQVLGIGGQGYLQNIIYVSAGRSGTHSLAVDSSGYVYGWGNNASGQCGTGDNINKQVPVQVLTTSGSYLSNIISVNAGVNHSLALSADGTVWEFGGNNNTNKAVLVPGVGGVGNLVNIIAIATCSDSLAVDTDGNVFYWKNGNPVQVSGLSDIIEVSVGSSGYMALDSDGYVWKWTSSTAPYKVPCGDMNTSSGDLESIKAIDMAYHDFQMAVDIYGRGWSWGTVNSNGELGAGDTASHTLPVEIVEVVGQLELTFEDSTDGCCANDEIITYTFCYDNLSCFTYENVYLVDMLPQELDYYDGDFTFDYMNMDRCYYNLGTLYPDDIGCVELRAVVTGYAEPGFSFTNNMKIVSIAGSEYDPNSINWTTIDSISLVSDVCCPEENPAIIYISETAKGGDSGIDWNNAYSGRDGLQKAFNRINNSACTGYDYILYVGAGTYYPGDSSSDTFALLENMEMYGGFPAEGCDFADRNTKKYKPVLTGQVDDDSYIDINTIVTMGNNTVLDGFIVENANRYCVYGENADFVLKNCEIRNSERFGVYALAGDDYGDVTIKSCKINDNEESGVYHEGTGYNLNIYNSWVMRSGYNGVYTQYSTLTAKNNIVSQSYMKAQSQDTEKYQGIRIEYPTDTPIIYGNTISNNNGEGLYYSGSGASANYPDLQNCIIYYNNRNADGNGNGQQLSGVDPEDVASYCFIQGCSNLALQIYDMDPMFACPEDPNGTPDLLNYHLAYNSVCKDIGNASLVTNDDLDYDNESRIFGAGVDIGADEVYSCDGDITEDDISNPLDWTDDGIINLGEFKYISEAWLSHDPNDPVWANDPNYADDIAAQVWHSCCNIDKAGDSQYQIDISDLEMFLNDAPWLWEACWYGKALEDVEITLETMSLMSTSLTSSNTMVSVARTTSAIMYVEEESEADPYEEMSNAELAVVIRDLNELSRAVEAQYYSGCEDEEDLLDLLDFLDDEIVILYEHIEE